ncbi:MAG TPA: Ig-like domain-containing protein, partial [Symbiobacteriaceae bacterium]|nr:Ig-like domain-containing protein [Symbiobacteriaceae bacterium]
VVKTFPAHGSLGMGPDGSLTYTPENGFVGTDTFTYAAFDGTGESMPVTVTITVNRLPPPPQNSQPFANHDAYTVDEDGTLTIAARGVLLNDTDPDGDVLSALLFSGPAKGTLALNANGSFIYTPAPLFHGTDTFKYRVSDGSLVSNVATVTITVRHVNHAPVATDDAYSVNQDAVLTVQAGGVLGNDTDVDKDALTALLVAGPAHGTVALNADGSFQYTPAAGYHGPDSFRYQAFDGAAKSNVATAAVSIRPGAPPVAKKPTISGVVIDAATGQVIAGATVAVSADFDADGTPDFTESVQTGADGRYKIEVPRSEWTYTAIVSTPVTTAAGAMTVVTSHTTVVPKSETGGVYNAERKIAGQIYLQAGPGAQMMKPDQVLSKGVKIAATLLGPNGAVGQVQVNDQGLFEATGMPPGQYKVAVKVTAPDGTALAGTAIGAAVTGDGELVVGSALINPGSRIFDAVTKLPVDDVTVTLYWADTPLNKLKGRTPDTVVSLPMVPVFLPGMNHVPATSAGGGVYAWLVHPDGDYYIIAEKLGYRTFDSRTAGATLHVDAGLLKYDFEMEPVHARFIRGYPDGTFKPEQQITRAEVAAILARIVQPTKVELPAPPFGDVSASHWAATYIELVRQKGLMMGDPNGNFRPEDAITRAELATILARFKSLQLDAPNPFTDTVGHWAEAAISAAYRVGLITGYPDGTFHPQALTNRAEAATMINRMLGRGPLAGRAAPTWPDVPFSHWASGQVEEASSSHSAVRGEHDHELWTSDTGVPTW